MKIFQIQFVFFLNKYLKFKIGAETALIRSDSESECDSVDFVTRNVALMSSSRPQKWREPRGFQPSVIAFTKPTGIYNDSNIIIYHLCAISLCFIH